MVGGKRQAAPSTESKEGKVRRSRRGAPQAPPLDVDTRERTLSGPNVEETVTAMNRRLQTHFNPYIAFARGAAPNSATYREAKAIQDGLDTLQRIISDAEEQLAKHCDALQHRIVSFYDVQRQHADWFLRANIMSLNVNEIADALKSNTEIDTAALAKYLERIFIEQEETRILGAEEHEQDTPRRRDRLDQCSLNILQQAKISYLLSTLFTVPGGQGYGIDVAMAYLLHVLRPTPLARRAYDGLLNDLKEHLGAPSAWGMAEDMRKGTPPFMDFARRARQMRETAVSEKEASCSRFPPYDAWQCFHHSSKPLLDSVRQHAYGEVRTKVMLTVGTQLPAELTEKVFEWALLAEELRLAPQAYTLPHNALDESGEEACKVLKAWRKAGGQPSECES